MTSHANAQVARSMSYRKPVPVYVPSPPSSPIVPAMALELEDANCFQSNVPPLPENWREIITTKILEVNSSNVSVHTFQKTPTTSETGPSKGPLPYTTRDEEDQALLTVPPAASKSSHRRHSTRGLPTHYRSPTPPLPSSKPLRLSPESQFGAENVTLPMSPYYIPSSPGPGPEIIQLSAEARSLKLSSSFQTDRTVVSHGTGPISTPWSRSFGTLAYWEPSNRSTHPEKEVGDLSELIGARSGSTSSLLSCGFLSSMIKGLKDLCRCKA